MSADHPAHSRADILPTARSVHHLQGTKSTPLAAGMCNASCSSKRLLSSPAGEGILSAVGVPQGINRSLPHDVQGVRNLLSWLDARPGGSCHVVITDLREELAVYVNGRPYLRRELDMPSAALHHAGISTLLNVLKISFNWNCTRKTLQHLFNHSFSLTLGAQTYDPYFVLIRSGCLTLRSDAYDTLVLMLSCRYQCC